MRAAVVGMLLLCGIAQGAEPKTVTNSIGMELIEIPAGKFRMGSPANEKDRESFEEQVAVTLTKPFWLGKTEVTQGQFKNVMGTGPWKGREYVQIGKNVAASFITWDEAKMFCDELTELEQEAGKLPEGESYRLPSEAEWEYACRAGTETAFSFGNNEKQLGDFAWFDGNMGRAYHAYKVGLKKPNPWGLFDMHGNVLEWCSDWWGLSLPGGTDPINYEGHPENRVVRNRKYSNSSHDCRSASREPRLSSDRSDNTGFRVARSQSAQ